MQLKDINLRIGYYFDFNFYGILPVSLLNCRLPYLPVKTTFIQAIQFAIDM